MRVLLCLVLLSPGAFADERPTVEAGMPQVSGDAARDAVREQVGRTLPKIRACYEKQLLATPGLVGRITVTFTIEPTGKVRSSTPSPLGGAALVAVGTCVAEVIQKIEFTRQASAVTVGYPFVFQPSAPPTRSLRKDRVMFPRVLRQHREQLQACYETELRKQPDLSGTVTATFTVETDGTVSKATATGVDPAVSSCVANAIKLVVFERPVRKTDVSYPFVFEALGEATPITSGSDDDTMMVRRHIKRSIAKIQFCYEQQRAKQPTLAGTVRVAFEIDATGKVTRSSGDGVDPAVATCVARVVQGIVFDKPSKPPLSVNYPLTFRASP